MAEQLLRIAQPRAAAPVAAPDQTATQVSSQSACLYFFCSLYLMSAKREREGEKAKTYNVTNISGRGKFSYYIYKFMSSECIKFLR